MSAAGAKSQSEGGGTPTERNRFVTSAAVPRRARASGVPRGAAAKLTLALVLFFSQDALAGGAGSQIPETGGQGAGAASADARGLSANPAAAIGANGTDMTFDVGLMVLDVHYQRAPYEGTDPNNDPDRTFRGVDSFNTSLVPYAAVRTDAPFGREKSKVGFGMSVSVPFGRKAGFDADYPGRYHLVSVDYSTLYATPVVAVRPTKALRFGLGPVVGITEIRLRQRVDLAPTLQEIAPGDPAPPPESGLLEGEISVREASGVSYGFTAGVAADLGEQTTLGVGFLSGQQSSAKGRSKLTPSLDLTLYTVGDFTLTQNLPPIVNVGARHRLKDKPLELSVEGQWVGWSVNRYFHLEIENSEVASTNSDLQDLLDFLAAQGFDLNEGQVIENIFDKDQYIARQYRNTWNVITGVEWQWSQEMRSRFQIGYDRSAIPDETANIGNMDFDAIVLGAGITYAPGKSNVRLGLGISQYLTAGREVKNSRFATHDRPVEYSFPSGDGTYSAVLSRVAANVSYRF